MATPITAALTIRYAIARGKKLKRFTRVETFGYPDDGLGARGRRYRG
jgi:hypothetical protein